MNAIGPGDVVECVDASPYKGSPVPLTVGARYVVLAVWNALPYKGTDHSWMDCAVTLEGVPDPEPLIAWGLFRFKPVGPTPLDHILKREPVAA